MGDMTKQITTEAATIEELLAIVSKQARDSAAALADQRVASRVQIQTRDQRIAELEASHRAALAKIEELRDQVEGLQAQPGDVVPGEVLDDN